MPAAIRKFQDWIVRNGLAVHVEARMGVARFQDAAKMDRPPPPRRGPGLGRIGGVDVAAILGADDFQIQPAVARNADVNIVALQRSGKWIDIFVMALIDKIATRLDTGFFVEIGYHFLRVGNSSACAQDQAETLNDSL
ncbi:hypothetical protein [Verminephrobacter aporrectodeae]|uniref:hypothetical protein n=1 Tax=Verminephrobacter aporrectodeae TaxID=1110389 RepID=UPI0022445822|nr:hypothetical protein [Verminephrobacter aporrectodeae]